MYTCPRCGGTASRKRNQRVQAMTGIMGSLFYAAFGPITCEKCGKVPRSEFSASDRRRMFFSSVAFSIPALALVVVLLALLSRSCGMA